jgi:hypothetical protein
MNVRYKHAPEVISSLKTINAQGEDAYLGDHVTAMDVLRSKTGGPGIARIEIRNFKKEDCLIVEIELPELVAAISTATLNAVEE